MDVAALVARYKAVTSQEEEALLTSLVESGWEAGCWIRPAPELILTATQDEIAKFLKALRRRRTFQRQTMAEPYPNGRPQENITGEDPCYIVISQRCDICGPLNKEPLIELAPAAICKDEGRIERTWRNSSREFPVDSKVTPSFIIDLRYRFFISKPDLADIPCKQALPLDENVRQRFVLRTSQRYMRAAVPDHLVEEIVKPLGRIVCGDSEATEIFTEWALFHGGQREKEPGIVATYRIDIDETLNEDEQLTREDEIRQRAEDKFQKILEKLPQTAKDAVDLDDDRRTKAVSET